MSFGFIIGVFLAFGVAVWEFVRVVRGGSVSD